jgi:PhzF family phenazine biosynthesis protein
MLRLSEASIAPDPLWVDTGAEQLVLPVATVDDVRAARPDADLLLRHAFSPSRGEAMAYVWARATADTLVARFFFVAGAVLEDPATGSACANLGGWMIAAGKSLPLRATVHQGDAVKRPSRLALTVDAERQVFVGGEVVEVGRGTFTA